MEDGGGCRAKFVNKKDKCDVHVHVRRATRILLIANPQKNRTQ